MLLGAELSENLLCRLSRNENDQETTKWEFKVFDPNRYYEIRFAHWMICL